MRTIKPQSSRFTVPSWVKWATSVLAVLLILGGAFVSWMYFEINQDRTAGQEEASQLALDRTDLAGVDRISVYRGAKAVHIVEGKTSQGDSGLVFVDVENKQILDEVFKGNIISKTELREKWAQDCEGCSFKYIQYAYEENQPVYEITYIDEQNRYVLDYFKLSGENFDQRFAFRQN
jgi:uncharacterized protein YpmB